MIVDGKFTSELTINPHAKEMGEYLFDVSELPLTNKTSECREVSHSLNLELAIRYSVRSCSRKVEARPARRVLLTSNCAFSGSCRSNSRSLDASITGALDHALTRRAQLRKNQTHVIPFMMF